MDECKPRPVSAAIWRRNPAWASCVSEDAAAGAAMVISSVLPLCSVPPAVWPVTNSVPPAEKEGHSEQAVGFRVWGLGFRV